MVDGERTILRDPSRYIAHPHMTRVGDGTLLLVATSGPRRETTLHPPLDPDFVNVVIRSDDDGDTWSAPSAVPALGVTGMECAGLTALSDGSVLVNQWQFRWYCDGRQPQAGEEPWFASAEDLNRELDASLELDSARGTHPIGWARGGGTVTVCRSLDAGRSWSTPGVVDVSPYSGGYGMRGGVVLPSGEILLPLSDVPHYARIFLVRSVDGGRHWLPPEPVCAVDGRAFEEPAPYLASDGSIILMLRENVTRRLHSVHSIDGGRSWTSPRPSGVTGFPAELVALGGGQVAAVTAIRDFPGEIRLHHSDDEGRHWSEQPVQVSGNLGTRDCGYPTAAVIDGGDLFVVYYRRDETGVTGLYGRRVQKDEQRPRAA